VAKKRPKVDPNRFKQSKPKPAPTDNKGMFAFDPVRRNVMMWGFIVGAAGGAVLLIEQLFAQIAGVFIIILVSNYHINQASQQISRWHATINSFIGLTTGLILSIAVGTIVISILSARGG
jgi:hypothetical protein